MSFSRWSTSNELKGAARVSRGNCRHEEREPFAGSRVGDVLPVGEGSKDIRRQRFSVRGRSLSRCTRCGEVLFDSTDRPVGPAVHALAVAAPSADVIRLEWADSNATSLSEPPPRPRARPGATEAAAPFTVSQPRFRLDDCILNEATRRQIGDAVEKVTHHQTIYERWGFGAVDPRGAGNTLNFYGPPGTGKSRTAEALAAHLGLSMISVTAGDIESRFLGESPKQVGRLFDMARSTNSLLFFDEADAIFGKRASDVTQGVDHEVNATKSKLLVELEEHPGLVVLATNFESNIDRAFVRRVSWNIEFQLPDQPSRARLFELHFPVGAPYGADPTILAQAAAVISHGLSGGDVLTVVRRVLPAAIRAAEGDPDRAVVTEDLIAGEIEEVLAAKGAVGRGSSRTVRDSVGLGPPLSELLAESAAGGHTE